MKIYTKTGDKGSTSLLGGTRVPKDHIRIESYGTVDELNSYIGLVRDQKIDPATVKSLISIQERLFTIGAVLATDPEKKKVKTPDLTEQDITFIEQEIDQMEAALPEIHSFILPGGHTTVSFCHLARVVCRRAERNCIALSHQEEVPEIIIKYLNRLSDYLFVLSRKLSRDLGAEEIPWKPRG